MSLKSAWNYFSAPPTTQPTNDFVGQVLEIGKLKLRITRVIAEGGFAFVYAAQDVSTGEEFAVKRLLAADEKTRKKVMQEIAFLRQLSGHPNILRLVDCIGSRSDTGRAEFLLVTELCCGGLIDVLRSRSDPLPLETVTQIFHQTCRAVQLMHRQDPPIIHRDLKAIYFQHFLVENLLLGNDGAIKLCDFGSATTTCHFPDLSWPANKRALVEDEMTEHTTPMYRAPEMLDTWNNYPINVAVDIWALGCILYMLCFMSHPYEDSAKLRIINANYTIPAKDGRFQVYHDLIRGMFQVDPRQRPTISDCLDRIAEIAEVKGINLKENPNLSLPCPPTHAVSPAPVQQEHLPKQGMMNPNGTAPQPPLPHAATSNHIPPQAQAPSPHSYPSPPNVPGFLTSLRGGAGSFLKNLKDTSSKVMQTVQQSIAKTDLDFTYLTSRLAVMPFPAEGLESAYRNHVEDVRSLLESRHSGHYAIYNVSGRSYSSAKFNARVTDCGWPAKRAPSLVTLYSLCQSTYDFLAMDPRNIAIVHCIDGKSSSATLACAFLCFAGSLILQPIPAFTKMRDGCRPYVEVWSGDELLLSTIADYERLRLYHISEGRMTFPLNVSLNGDVSLLVYHARSTFGSKMQGTGKVSGIKIFQVQFHTGFIQPSQTHLIFSKNDIDDVQEPERYPSQFSALLEVRVGNPIQVPSPPPWAMAQPRDPIHAFVSRQDFQEAREKFASVKVKKPERPPPPPPSPARGPSPLSAADENQKARDFMASLNWEAQHDQYVPSEEAGQLLSGSEEEEDSSAVDDGTADLLNLGGTETNGACGSTGASTGQQDELPDVGLLNLEDSGGPTSPLLKGLSPPTKFTAPSESTQLGVDTFTDLFGGPTPMQQTSKTSDFFDPFGGASLGVPHPNMTHSASTGNFISAATVNSAEKGSSGAGGDLLGGWDSFMNGARKASLPRNSSTPNLEAAAKSDPFADLGNLAGLGGSKPNSPMHQTKPFPGSAQSPPGVRVQGNEARNAQLRQQAQPDYSRTNFDSVFGRDGNSKPFGPKPKVSADTFGDLLGSQGFEFSTKKDQGPTTINAMRREIQTKEVDPTKLKILDWTNGKQRNIRALLGSLHTIIWDGCRWEEVGMHQLVSANDIKKFYRKACLAVHPDKVRRLDLSRCFVFVQF
ncbi:unnamed protein product, partial [Darwinula stevensoni]